MNALRTFAAAKAFALVLVAGPAVAASAAKPAPAPSPQPPAGTYVLDKAHTSVTFRVSHMGFSRYTASFRQVDGRLQFDPAHPADRLHRPAPGRLYRYGCVDNPAPARLDRQRVIWRRLTCGCGAEADASAGERK